MPLQRSLLVLALTGAVLCSVSSAISAAAITHRAVGEPLSEAFQLRVERKDAEAMARLRQARAAPGIKLEEIEMIDRLMLAWGWEAGGAELVDREATSQLRAGQRSVALLHWCTRAALELRNFGKTAQCSAAAGPN